MILTKHIGLYRIEVYGPQITASLGVLKIGLETGFGIHYRPLGTNADPIHSLYAFGFCILGFGAGVGRDSRQLNLT